MTPQNRLFKDVDRLSENYKGTVWRNYEDGSYYVVDVFGVKHKEYDIVVGVRSTKNNDLWFCDFDNVFTKEFERVVY